MLLWALPIPGTASAHDGLTWQQNPTPKSGQAAKELMHLEAAREDGDSPAYFDEEKDTYESQLQLASYVTKSQ